MWLNDDTFLFNFALDTLFVDTFPNSIVCGVTKSSISDNLTYGGYSSKLKKALIPNNFYQNVDYCNGNCVIVPRDVFKKLGYLDPIFHHALGDFDYSLRATKKGFEIKIAPEYIGFCELHDTIPKWRNSSINLYNRLKYLYSPLSGCHPSEIFIFDLRHNDLFKAILHFFTIHLRCFFPKFWSYIF
jgi:GT2 family glycosyltransferase